MPNQTTTSPVPHMTPMRPMLPMVPVPSSPGYYQHPPLMGVPSHPAPAPPGLPTSGSPEVHFLYDDNDAPFLDPMKMSVIPRQGETLRVYDHRFEVMDIHWRWSNSEWVVEVRVCLLDESTGEEGPRD